MKPKTLLIFLAFLFCAALVQTQAKKNNSQAQPETVKSDSFQQERELLETKIAQLQQDSITLTDSLQHVVRFNEELQFSNLRNISYFLYQPFSASIFNQIILPSVNAINSPQLLSERKARIDILKNFQTYINDLRDFITDDMIEDFGNDAPEILADLGAKYLAELQLTPLYKSYHDYDAGDWQETTLGRYIFRLENVFKNPDKTTSSTLSAVRKELTEILK